MYFVSVIRAALAAFALILFTYLLVAKHDDDDDDIHSSQMHGSECPLGDLNGKLQRTVSTTVGRCN